MNMKVIEIMARELGIKPRGKTKAVLIREIQRAEGNFDCFGSAVGYCDQVTCSFYADCLYENTTKIARKPRKVEL